MSEIAIRLATPGDAATLAELIIEMQQHYGSPHPPQAEIAAHIAKLPPGVEILVAERAGSLAGLAGFSTIFPGPGVSGGIFLKDLYVAGAERDSGLGQALMKALAALAVTRGLQRIDWTVAKTNVKALGFYDRLGGEVLSDRHFYRLTGAALRDLAS